MQYIQLTQTDGLLNICMARPKANAFHGPMVEEMRAALATAAGDPSTRGVVLSSGLPRFFSAGLDAQEIFPYGAAQIKAFFGGFVELYHSILDLPKPVVAAIGGHAMAGGAVLALACDARVMGEGAYGFALNEINLGMALTPGVLQMAIRTVGAGCARELILEGRTIDPQRAVTIGVANELVPAEQVQARAEERARFLMDKPPLAFTALKRLFRELMVAPPASDAASLDHFAELWDSAEGRERRESLAASLRR
jgi:Delta3-Delta2-enoyl-CoA isomerase